MLVGAQGGVNVGRKPFKSPDEKLTVVLSVLKGETTQVEVARRLSNVCRNRDRIVARGVDK
jgi:hypothetical protein